MTSDHLHFHAAGKCELPELHFLIESAYRGNRARAGWTHEADLLETPRTSIDTLASIIDDSAELLLLAMDGAAIIGCVQVTRLSPTTAYFGLLTVDPQRQNGGLGKQIIAAAESEAMRRFGSTAMELSVVSERSELIAYYERRGYVATGEQRPFPIAIDPPLTLAVYRKPLSARP
ncbi:GNAT family N-acetyltransferase [Sphingomonas sp. So64.6b]|uniref:GNAT family N-acetyltransferase n=1 Tax=Sphingomonas sp. So64.6b TaxID=2997354 RepID=UPI001602D169|nr:GNAT family N-acetyltransferase [Sphingomonas sp. So64.6b]QNA86358.1 GNAT family N-acetyltransferase [Sphingomonas sp. So64.6b]